MGRGARGDGFRGVLGDDRSVVHQAPGPAAGEVPRAEVLVDHRVLGLEDAGQRGFLQFGHRLGADPGQEVFRDGGGEVGRVDDAGCA
jgi:hypothetical protein